MIHLISLYFVMKWRLSNGCKSKG
ncbi:hypothetical protein [Streptococcus uberis]